METIDALSFNVVSPYLFQGDIYLANDKSLIKINSDNIVDFNISENVMSIEVRYFHNISHVLNSLNTTKEEEIFTLSFSKQNTTYNQLDFEMEAVFLYHSLHKESVVLNFEVKDVRVSER